VRALLRLLCVPLLAKLLAGASTAEAQEEGDLVIVPGQEATIVALFHGPPIEGCVWDGASPDRSTIHVRYRCDARLVELDLGPAAGHPPGPLRSNAFFIRLRSGEPPGAFLREFVERLAQRDATFRWTPATQGVSRPPPTTLSTAAQRVGWSWRDPVPACCVALSLLAMALLALALRGRGEHERWWKRASTGERLVSIFAMVSAVVTLGHAVRSPIIDGESLATLGSAAEQPWFRGSLRFLSINVFHWLAARAGASLAAIVLVNAFTAALAAACLAGLLRRLDWPSHVAATAAGLWLASGAVHFIVGMSIGFQIVAGCFALFGSVFAAVASVDDTASRPSRLACAALAVTLATLGVWIKFVLVALAAPSVLLLAALRDRRLVGRGVAIAASQTTAFLLSQPRYLSEGDDLDKVGVGRVATNAAKIADLASLESYLLLASLAAAAGVWIWTTRGRPLAVASAGKSMARSAVLVALGVLWTIPFLLNERYCMPHYSILAVVPLLAHAAWAMCDGAGRFAPSAALSGLLLVAFGLRMQAHEAPRDTTLAAFVTDLRASAAAMPTPSRVFVLPRCDGAEALAETRSLLSHLREIDPFAYRWVTGWRGVPIHLIQSDDERPRPWPGERAAYYCRGAALMWDPPVPAE
jgi:hypothetical protein